MKKLLIIIGLLFLAYVALVNTAPTGEQEPRAQAQSLALASPDGALTTTPTITAKFIDNILCNASSPACGTGADMYNDGVQYGVDPAYALAFFQHESTFGKYGIANSNLSLGNIRCSSGYSCKYGFRAYASWAESYADWYRLVRYYIDTLHKTTLREILYTYAPPIENATDGYIAAICKAVNDWRTEARRGA